MDARKKILLVDDDEAVTDVLHAKLGKYYDMVSTNDPEKAVALAREHQPDLVLCDIDMPDTDGGDVSSAFYAAEDLRGMPFMFLTALATPQDLEATRKEIGGRPAVSKLASAKALLERIRSIVGS